MQELAHKTLINRKNAFTYDSAIRSDHLQPRATRGVSSSYCPNQSQCCLGPG